MNTYIPNPNGTTENPSEHTTIQYNKSGTVSYQTTASQVKQELPQKTFLFNHDPSIKEEEPNKNINNDVSQNFTVIETTLRDQIDQFWEETRKRNNYRFLKDYVHDHDYTELAASIPYHLFEDPDLVEETNDQPLPSVIMQFIGYISDKQRENTKRMLKIE